MEEKSAPKRPYFRESTASQRRLLFETWERTGSVKKACETAKLGRVTFYHWKTRFEKEGYAGLENSRSYARHNTGETPREIEEKVVAMRKEHPDWGQQRIADELMKSNRWIPVISASTVYRILVKRKLMRIEDGPKKKSSGRPSRRKTRANSQY